MRSGRLKTGNKHSGDGTPSSIYGGITDFVFTSIDNMKAGLAGVESKTVVRPKEGTVAYLSSGGRSGNFIWNVGDFSSEVSTDTLNGIYVADGSDPAGGKGCWVRCDWDGITLKYSWFEDLQGSIDFLSAIYNDPFGGTSKHQPDRGEFILDKPVTLTQYLQVRPNIDYKLKGKLSADNSIVLSINDSVIDCDDDDFYNASIDKLYVVGNNLDAYAFNLDARRCDIGKTRTLGLLKGCIIRGGYGNTGVNIKPVGTDTNVSLVYTPDAYGFQNYSTDSEFTDIVPAFFQKGIGYFGNNCRWYSPHAWSLPATVPMKIGHDIANEGQRILGGVSDTPSPDNAALPPSLINGGYGWLTRGNGADSQLIGCDVIASEQTGNVDATVIPFKVNKETTLLGCNVRNYASTTNIFITPYTQFISHTVKQLSTVIGGNALSSESGNLLIPNSMPNMTHSVELAIGGTSTGISYNNGTNYCAFSTIGMFTQFLIKFKLANKGSSTGDVSITGLPFTALNGYGDTLRYMFKVHTANNYVGEIEAHLTPSTNEMQLYFSDTQLAVQDTDILSSTEFVVSGQVMTSDGFFDDID